MGEIGRSVRIGAGWMVLFKLADRSLGLVSTIILARLLVPADFGLVAMAAVVIAMLELLQAFGFDMALIRNTEAGRPHYDTVWTFKVLFGLITALGLVALAWPASAYYMEPRLPAVMSVLAVGALVQGFENVGIVDFRKELEFDREFRFMLTRRMAGFVVTLIAAFVLRNYWALVIGMVFGRLFGTVLSYRVHPYRPRFSMAERRDLFGFSKWILLNSIITYVYRYSADLVIGRIGGASALGLFTIGREIAMLPSTELIAPINRAIFPGYAKLSGDLAALREGYLKVTGVLALLCVPAAAGIAAVAGPLVLVVFGEKWAGAIPVVQIMALASAIRALQANTYYVHLACGTVRNFVWVSVVNGLLLVPVLAFFTFRDGVAGAANAYLAVGLCVWPLYLYSMTVVLQVRAASLLGTMWRPAVAAAVMYLALSEWSAWLSEAADFGPLALLLSAIVVGALVYGATVLVLWQLASRPPGAEAFGLETMRAAWRQLGPARR